MPLCLFFLIHRSETFLELIYILTCTTEELSLLRLELINQLYECKTLQFFILVNSIIFFFLYLFF